MILFRWLRKFWDTWGVYGTALDFGDKLGEIFVGIFARGFIVGAFLFGVYLVIRGLLMFVEVL